MKKVWRIILAAFILALAYNLIIFWFPVNRKAYYTNTARAEGFTFDKKKYDVVVVGSSLSGCFEGVNPFPQPYFNLFFPFTGSCTGVDIINRSGRIPKYLFVEINHIDRGLDSTVIGDVFENALYPFKYYVPILQSKNKLLTNVIELVKKPASNINKQKPPAELFNKLLSSAQKEWEKYPDQNKFDKQFDKLSASLDVFAKKGCKIYFYEVPIDSSIRNSNLMRYQRERMTALAQQKGYTFFPSDTSRAYETGDGIHMLQADRDIYVKYFKAEIEKNGIFTAAKN